MENFTLSLIINDSKETFATSDVPCFTFTNHLILKVFMVFAYVLVIGTSIIGNTLLAFIYFKSKNMKTTINCCIMNMVLADLLVTLVYMPRMVARILVSLEWLVEGTLGLFLCVLVSFSQEISICVSILTVLLIAFERFLAVTFPLRVFISKKFSICLLCGTWLLSLAARSPMLYGVKTIRFQSGELGCFWIGSLSFQTKQSRRSYQESMLVIFYGLPLLIIITIYTVIAVFLRRRHALIDNVTRDCVLATTRKVNKMILAVITAFLLCWLLYFLVIPLQEFWNVVIPCEVHFLRFYLGHLNSACNPIICFAFSENFRRAIQIKWRELKIERSRIIRLAHAPSKRDRSRSNIELLSVRSLGS